MFVEVVKVSSPTRVPPNCLYIPLKVLPKVINWAPSCNISFGVHLRLKMSENMLLLTLYLLKTNLATVLLPVCCDHFPLAWFPLVAHHPGICNWPSTLLRQHSSIKHTTSVFQGCPFHFSSQAPISSLNCTTAHQLNFTATQVLNRHNFQLWTPVHSPRVKGILSTELRAAVNLSSTFNGQTE